MERTYLGPGLGELDDGSDPAMSFGVATERSDGVDVALSGLIHPEGTPVEQTAVVFEMIEDMIVDDLGGEMGDVTRLRFYVREDVLTADLRRELHELRRDVFSAPEYPAATMVGVSSLVHDDADVEVEASAFVPADERTVTTIRPD
ncbi:RidA family protein [Halobaculum sp. CBA1158]|uniref:RidA family protein n=1 Tax=Halobaculum sp. CBA1158 TaxID=2904243 RepID=UPI001F40560B|nr:RidA family protein [Halobaculum sp. CBA1158]UIO99019.1 RidA family protein [Halobaculum sp. CBA1158]